MRKALFSLFLGACVQQVTAPGVSECFKTWYVIGWYSGCAHGPEWGYSIETGARAPAPRSPFPPATSACTAGAGCTNNLNHRGHLVLRQEGYCDCIAE